MPDFDLLIRGAALVDPAENAVPGTRDLAVRGGRIAAVEAAGVIPPDRARAVLEAEGQALLPGLVNAHAHASMTLLRGLAEDVTVESWFNDVIWRVETNLKSEDAYWGAKLAALEMIEAGVTCVADHYLFMEAVAPAFAEAGLRAHLAPTMFGSDPDGELGRARAFAAAWHGAGEGRIRAWLGPHSPYLCSGDFLRRVRAEADALEVGVHLHVSETAGQVAASLHEHGLTPIAYLGRLGVLDGPALLAHAAHATADDLSLLAASGAGVAHCPKTFLKLASGILDVVGALALGVRVGLGTDGAASNNTLDVLEQARLTAMLQKHQRQDATLMRTREALALATAGGAAALGLAGELGTLRVGAWADLVLVDLSGAHLQPVHDLAAALLYSARAADVRTVVVQGRVLMRNREHLTLNREEILQEATERGLRLAATPAAGRLQAFPGSSEPSR
jgi:5-methylthioadenosine/S-adenosylhomocysteine deaminase